MTGATRRSPGSDGPSAMVALRSVSRGVVWLFRGLSVLAELGLLITGVMVIVADGGDEFSGLALWDCLAFVYLVLGSIGFSVRSRVGEASTSGAPRQRRSPIVRRLLAWYWGLLPVVFSVLGVLAAVSVLLINQTSDPDLTIAMKAAGAVAMVAAWLLLHVSYARRYQWFYEHEDGGLEFPGIEPPQRPTPVDFLYFAITLGSSFATSDTSVTTTRMRAHVLVHSVLSFFYNAIVLAVAFRIITGG